MPNMTVNKLLEMQKALKERRNQLEKLTLENTKSTRWYGTTEKLEEPKYDVKALDHMIVGINNALFEISASLKESNATTKLDVNVDFEKLMRPIG